ncbi:ribbon-helix-helix protein, CopG family [Vineibacter terrae]|uniref:Ribbon-helix-helix protein, CopG family n=1 Tax=Vineibacter terrae TaxID=2586908 RepID=A0A5C8PCV9_9HYPH|nr:type II toxin-antitoxin system HicB family antitoxin [Vineibacter terrae]TXL71191.1 ribbon-helix-helix protein, CopG family [Vineibacter terrae]
MQHYIAFVHGEPGAYGISFPDFPGCISAGGTVEEAVSQGIEALHLHLEGMVEDGTPVPAPSAVEAIRANPEFAEELDGAVVTLVPVVTPAGKPLRINVSLDEALVAQIDKAAELAGVTRSGFLADAARRALRVA